MILRIAKIIGLVLASLLLIVVVALFIVPRTGPGKSLIDGIARPIVEDVVAAQLGSEIRFDRISGALPGEIVLEDIAFTQDGTVWLSGNRVVVRWVPLSLLRGRIRVAEVVGDDIVLHRTPDMPEREESPPSEEESGPFSLPSIELGRAQIAPFSIREAVLGERYDVTITLSARTKGRQVDAEATVRTTTDTDAVDLAVLFDDDALTLDIAARSAADGFLTRAARAEERMALSLEGQGPLDAWAGQIDLQAGNYGEVIGALGGNLAAFSAADLAVVVSPGALVPEAARQAIGPDLRVVAETRRTEEEFLVTVGEVSGAFGFLKSQVRVTETADRIAVAIDGQVEQEVLDTYGAGFVAGPISLQAEADRTGDAGTALAGTLTSEAGVVTLAGGRLGGPATFAGQIAADLSRFPALNPRIDPILQRGVVLGAGVTIPSEGGVVVQDLTLKTGGTSAQTVALSGDFVLEATGSEMDADAAGVVRMRTILEGQAGAEAAAKLVGADRFDGPLVISATVMGAIDALAIDGTVTVPAGALNGRPFPAGTVSANVDGVPAAPDGTIRLTSETGTYDGTVRLQSEGETIRIPQLAFRGGDLTVNGSGQVNRETFAGEAQLIVDAPRETTLVTGQTVSGTADIDARYGGGDAGEVTLDAQLNDFRYGDIVIPQATARANGTTEGLTFSLDGRDTEVPSAFLARYSLAGSAALAGGDRQVTLDRLMVAIEEDTEAQRITLLDPVTVGLGDAITVSPARFDWIADGTLSVSGRYGPERWVAEIDGEAVELPRLPAPLSLSLSLDTEEETIATFTARASRSPADEDTIYTVKADGRWTGDRLRVDATLAEDSADEPVATADIAYPVTLVRGAESLSVSLPDELLEGTIEAKGEIEPLYSFVPGVPPYLTGRLDANLILGGTPSAPEVEGEAQLSGGRFEEEAVGLTLTALEGRAEFSYGGGATEATLSLTGADANDRADAVRLEGSARLGEADSAIDVALTLVRATVVDSPQLTATASADLSLTGDLETLLAAGSIEVLSVDAAIPDVPAGAPSYTEVNVVRVDGPEKEQPDITPEAPGSAGGGGGPTIRLDIDVTAPDEIVIAGRGLDTEWAADLDITGTAEAPQIDGTVEIEEGIFEFAGRTFDFTEGRVTFSGREPTDAVVDIRAAYDASTVTAFVDVTGTIGDPKISLASNPARPDEDILALVLFGKQPTDLSAIESLQIANALRQLTGVGPSFGGGGGGGLEDALGLDALSFGVDQDSGEGVVELGKNLTENVYLSARQSAGGASSEVTLTYDVTDFLSLQSTLEPNGSQSVSARYKRDY